MLFSIYLECVNGLVCTIVDTDAGGRTNEAEREFVG